MDLGQETHVKDQALWEQALAATRNIYARLPPGCATELDGLIEEIMRLKQNLVELVIAAGSANICQACGGECCRYGRYHVSVLDIMAYLKSGAEPLTPDFSANPACPYSNLMGCTMAARFRPMTCVVFNCQQVEDLLSPLQMQIARGYEQELRDAIGRAGQISGQRLDRALLLSCCS